MQISKLDGAHRQLETAIRLFFAEGDPVAIHTLTGAARGLLRDLARAGGRDTELEGLLIEGVRPEHRKEVRGILVEAQNFFKHADRDAMETLDFNPATTEYLLWDCCQTYERLTGQKLPLLGLMKVWFALSHRDLLSDEMQAEFARIGSENIEDRGAFLESMLPFAEEWSSGSVLD